MSAPTIITLAWVALSTPAAFLIARVMEGFKSLDRAPQSEVEG